MGATIDVDGDQFRHGLAAVDGTNEQLAGEMAVEELGGIAMLTDPSMAIEDGAPIAPAEKGL
jgi:hypothetical protein